MELPHDKKELFIAGGVVVVAALLVVFLRSKSSNGSPTDTGSSSASSALVGGYQTADTVYVPTSSYNLTYITNKGTMDTTTNNNQTTQTYAPTNSGNNSPITQNSPSGTFTGSPIIGSPVAIHPIPPSSGIVTHPVQTPPPPIITAKPTTPPPPPAAQAHPVTPTILPKPNPSKPVPKPAPKPAPKPNPLLSAVQKSTKYATPKGGWNKGSVVDLLKANGDNSSMAARQKLASAAGIKGYTGSASQNVSLQHALEGAGFHY